MVVVPVLLLASVALSFLTAEEVSAFAANRIHSFPSLVAFTPSKITKRSMSASDNDLELPPGEMLDSLLDVAIRASKLAGEIILGNAGGADVLKSKANSRDLLTLVDPLCEKVRAASIPFIFQFVACCVLYHLCILRTPELRLFSKLSLPRFQPTISLVGT